MGSFIIFLFVITVKLLDEPNIILYIEEEVLEEPFLMFVVIQINDQQNLFYSIIPSSRLIVFIYV